MGTNGRTNGTERTRTATLSDLVGIEPILVETTCPAGVTTIVTGLAPVVSPPLPLVLLLSVSLL